MQEQSIAIISNPDSANTIDLITAFKKAGFNCTNYRIPNTSIDTDTVSNSDFFKHDVYIFRGFHLSYTYAKTLSTFLNAQGKAVFDNALFGNFIPSKLNEALIYKSANIPHPRVAHARTAEEWTSALSTQSYPLIIKRIDGERGRDVYKCNTIDEAQAIVNDEPQNFIAQEYIQTTFDVRVICIGDRVIGAIKRMPSNDDFRTNASLGGKTEKYQPSEVELSVAMKAHVNIGYDMSGVDIIHKEGEPLVLETNIAPEWQAFKNTTDIDVAAEFVKHIEERIP